MEPTCFNKLYSCLFVFAKHVGFIMFLSDFVNLDLVCKETVLSILLTNASVIIIFPGIKNGQTLIPDRVKLQTPIFPFS